MDLELVKTGHDAPNDVNVIIEIPMNSEPVKYEVDKATGAMFVDRVLTTPMHYPVNYGYVPHTLCEDGDPLDVLVIMPIPLISMSVINCRPVGILKMTDESGSDAKLLAMPQTRVFPAFEHVKDISDLNPLTLDRIAHFFEHYKDLEKGKWVKIEGWGDIEEARQEINDSIKRFADAPDKPHF